MEHPNKRKRRGPQPKPLEFIIPLECNTLQGLSCKGLSCNDPLHPLNLTDGEKRLGLLVRKHKLMERLRKRFNAWEEKVEKERAQHRKDILSYHRALKRDEEKRRHTEEALEEKDNLGDTCDSSSGSDSDGYEDDENDNIFEMTQRRARLLRLDESSPAVTRKLAREISRIKHQGVNTSSAKAYNKDLDSIDLFLKVKDLFRDGPKLRRRTTRVRRVRSEKEGGGRRISFNLNEEGDDELKITLSMSVSEIPKSKASKGLLMKTIHGLMKRYNLKDVAGFELVNGLRFLAREPRQGAVCTTMWVWRRLII